MVPDSVTIPRISDSLDFAGLAEKSCLRFTSSHGAPLLLHPSDADLLHALQPQYRLPAIARRRARSAPLWDLARDQSPRTRDVPEIEGSLHQGPLFEALQDKRGGTGVARRTRRGRSEEHTSELQSLMRNSYAVFCLKKKNK